MQSTHFQGFIAIIAMPMFWHMYTKGSNHIAAHIMDFWPFILLHSIFHNISISEVWFYHFSSQANDLFDDIFEAR